jgi:hypothetical protein
MEKIMFEQVYQSDDYCYSHDKEAGLYKKKKKKYKIYITLSGDDAIMFGNHIDIITSKPDETMNKRIEKVIGIHLYIYISSALEKENDKIAKP